MPKPTQRLWTLAALGAVMIHATGVALAVVHMQTNDADDSLGAPAIEVGLEMMSPRMEATDLPPGPDAEATAASPDTPGARTIIGLLATDSSVSKPKCGSGRRRRSHEATLTPGRSWKRPGRSRPTC